MTVEIEMLANARFEYYRASGFPIPSLVVEVNGRPCRVTREKALRLDGEIAALGPWDEFRDFFVIIPSSKKHGIHGTTKLEGYTNDHRYIDLVQQFVTAVDSGTFHEGPMEIPD